MIRKFLCGLLALVLGSSAAPAQQAGSVSSLQPNPSSTITVTNTFQSVFAGNPSRWGCTVQNNGTHTMFLFLGPQSRTATSASLQIAAGLAAQCAIGGGNTANDPVFITGTSGDNFYAEQW